MIEFTKAAGPREKDSAPPLFLCPFSDAYFTDPGVLALALPLADWETGVLIRPGYSFAGLRPLSIFGAARTIPALPLSYTSGSFCGPAFSHPAGPSLYV